MMARRESSDRGVLAPVTLRPAAETVADRLVTAIALGQFMLGERLPAERDLAVMLEVSRTTVREAVRQLVEGGYVRVERGRNGGIFVESVWGEDADAMIRRTLVPNWERLEQLLDFRAIIEGEIARVAATRRAARDVDAIRAAVHAYAEAGPDRASSSAADLRLHQTIAAATANPYLVELSLRVRRDVSLGIGAEPWSPRLRERALRQHPELAHAIVEGDVVRAGLLAAEHFSLTEQTIRDLLATVRRSPAANPPESIRGAHANRHA
jgi:GntR family transcriptional regulator, transcriptional repressor for pyruvate dehydrogenase complex